MPTLDQFESQFRSAIKKKFHFHERPIERALLVSDLEKGVAQTFLRDFQGALTRLDDAVEWSVFAADNFQSVSHLLEQIEQQPPDLICTYRNLFTRDRRWPYSLGMILDVLTQLTAMPVLVLPHPEDDGHIEPSLDRIETVLVITDQVQGSEALIDWALQLTPPDGELILAHVEDDEAFERYISTIGTIPEIDTAFAQRAIRDKLMAQASEYIESCRAEVERLQLPLKEVRGVVRMGHRVKDIKAIIEEHQADMIVLAVKDEDQLAMHGLSYPLAVEMQDLPMLMC